MKELRWKMLVAQVVAAMVLSSGAWADDRVYLQPSVSIGQVYDDNVFLMPASHDYDFLTRVSSSVETGYRSPLMHLVGRYMFEAERYRYHAPLDAALARQQAGATLQYALTPALRFA